MSKFAASRGHPVGPAAAQQRRVHRDHRQAGRSPLLWHVLFAARQRQVCRRDLAQQYDFAGRRRCLYGRYDLSPEPHGVVLHAPVAGHARCLMHGADQAAIALRPGMTDGAPYGTRTRVSAVKGGLHGHSRTCADACCARSADVPCHPRSLWYIGVRLRLLGKS